MITILLLNSDVRAIRRMNINVKNNPPYIINYTGVPHPSVKLQGQGNLQGKYKLS